MAKLTDIGLAPSVTLNSLIHIVNSGDTSQDPAGSSYKTPLSSVLSLVSTTSGYWTSGSTGSYSIKVINNSGIDSIGDYAVAEGYNTTARGDYSHSEGYQTIAQGDASHTEGNSTKALGLASHAEGRETTAMGNYGSHAEGWSTTAQGLSSHAEGKQTTASGNNSHAEGLQTTASGIATHAGGFLSVANDSYSFVHGNTSTASNGAIVLGNSITGSDSNKVYVGQLNINIAPSTDNTLTSVLARNSSGNVVQKQISGFGSFAWETKTNTGGITYNAVSNTGYISNNGHPSNPSEYLLPASATVGDVIKVNVLDGRAAFTVNSPQYIVYGTGNNDTGGSFTSPAAFNFGKYESAEVTYLGSNKWILSSFMTTDDLYTNPLTNRIY